MARQNEVLVQPALSLRWGEGRGYFNPNTGVVSGLHILCRFSFLFNYKIF